jgi:hypothetical protein
MTLAQIASRKSGSGSGGAGSHAGGARAGDGLGQRGANMKRGGAAALGPATSVFTGQNMNTLAHTISCPTHPLWVGSLRHSSSASAGAGADTAKVLKRAGGPSLGSIAAGKAKGGSHPPLRPNGAGPAPAPVLTRAAERQRAESAERAAAFAESAGGVGARGESVPEPEPEPVPVFSYPLPGQSSSRFHSGSRARLAVRHVLPGSFGEKGTVFTGQNMNTLAHTITEPNHPLWVGSLRSNLNH